MVQQKIRHDAMRIGGEKIKTDAVVDVRYPYTNEVIGTVPAGTAEHVRKAFEIAAAYEPKLTRYERQQILFRAAELIRARREEIAHWLTLELGICKQHSLYEAGRSYDVFTLAGQLAIHDDGQIFSCDLTPHGKSRKIFTKREPVRAISAITPFNHPLNMVAHKIAPSIATNNCMVCKPTELTPLTALTLADILYEAGLPPEMFQVVTGWPQDIGDEMITNPNIDIITFTGGVPVGKMIAQKAGYRRCALELGGNDPLIILNDLDADDLEKAATIAVAGATGNSGQRCTAVKRILVQESIADKITPLILEKAKAIRELANEAPMRLIPMADYRPKYPKINAAVEINPNHPNLTIWHSKIDVGLFIGVHCHQANLALKIIRGGTSCYTIAMCAMAGHEDACLSFRDADLNMIEKLKAMIKKLKSEGVKSQAEPFNQFVMGPSGAINP